jgi:hypothetical protein
MFIDFASHYASFLDKVTNIFRETFVGADKGKLSIFSRIRNQTTSVQGTHSLELDPAIGVNVVFKTASDETAGTKLLATREWVEDNIPTLQEVTDEFNTTTNDIIVTDGTTFQTTIGNGGFTFENDVMSSFRADDSQVLLQNNPLAENYVEMGFGISYKTFSPATEPDYAFYVQNGSGKRSNLFFEEPTGWGNIIFRDVINETETVALTSDIPTNTSDLVNDGEDGTSPYVTADQLPSNLNLFATNVSSDIATYFKLVTSIDDPDYNDTAVDIPTGAITTTNQFIASLATSAGVLLGNPGIINLTTVGNVRRTSGTGNAEFYYEVYHRDSVGTETLIATSSATPPVTVGVYTEFIALALLNNGTFLPTDRIVIKYYANRVGSGSDPSYEFQFGGTSPVRTSFPVPASNLPFSLDTLSDVNITTPLNGQSLVYDNGVWKNGNELLNLPFNIENAFVSLFNYLTTILNITFSSNAANSNNYCNWLPFQLNGSVEIDSFTIINNAANTSSGANSITIYIFDNSNDGLPGIKIHQEQSTLGILDTAQQVITFNNNISLDKGNYWIGIHLRGLNSAGGNPTFVGANGISVPSIHLGSPTYTNNNNLIIRTTGVSTDIGNNPTVTSVSSTSISYPLVYIKSILP